MSTDGLVLVDGTTNHKQLRRLDMRGAFVAHCKASKQITKTMHYAAPKKSVNDLDSR